MSQENTVRQFHPAHDPTGAESGAAIRPGRVPPAMKRLNINLPKRVFEELETMAKASGRTMTEVVRTGLGLVAIALEEEGTGGKIMVTDRKGKPVKEIILPR